MTHETVNILLLEDSPLDEDLACTRLAAGGIQARVRTQDQRGSGRPWEMSIHERRSWASRA
jgi:hypothetical protein